MTTPREGLRKFGVIWAGQLVSVIGSALSAFVIGVWVYLDTGSVTQFVLIQFCAAVPGILVSPVAGVLTDRWNRKRIMLAADLGAGVATVILLTLVTTDALTVWPIYLTTALSSACNTCHLVAYTALVPSLVPTKHLGRVNGLMQITQGIQIAAPLVAGALLGLVGLKGVLIIDLASMVVAVSTLAVTRLPAQTTPTPTDKESTGFTAGLRYLGSKPGLMNLVVVFAAFNFLFAIAGGLVQPLILSFSSPATLGVLMAAGGSGLFVGSVVMAAWGGPKRRVDGVYLGLLLGGVFLVLHSLYPSPWLIGIAAPCFLFTLPLMNTTCVTLLQTKVDPAMLGRVLGAVRMIATAATPIAFVLIGPLSDGVFEPLMAADGALADSVGTLIGTGDGRGIALIFMVVGVLMLAVAAYAYTKPRLRAIDTELPDTTLAPDYAQPTERTSS
jgi:DHA3 family macrolide efflux protein-like MFS transporter